MLKLIWIACKMEEKKAATIIAIGRVNRGKILSQAVLNASQERQEMSPN